MMLKDKVAVIYEAGGAVGGAVARAFAHEGAKLFLTGRHPAPVEAVAKDVVSPPAPPRRRRSTLSNSRPWTMGERDDGNDRQLDHGEPGRLAASDQCFA
jgi:NAD(P)-dependent dehydrogenase (short-subunit alcohol dehydrogenase family)